MEFSFLTKEKKTLSITYQFINSKCPIFSLILCCIHIFIALTLRSLLVHLYAVKNDETNDVSNLEKEKVFVTNGEFLDVLQLDQNKRPTIDVDGNKVFISQL